MGLLRGTEEALQIVTDGLHSRALQVQMREEMKAGRCLTFQTYEKKLQHLEDRREIQQQQPRAQNRRVKDDQKAEPEPQGQGRRKNSWQKRRDSEHDRAKIEEIVRQIQDSNHTKTSSETSEKKETFKDKCFKKWEAKIKEMSGKSLAQRKEMAKDIVDKFVSEAKAANSTNLNPDVIQKFWDRQVNKHFSKQADDKPSSQKGNKDTQQSNVRKVSECISSPEESEVETDLDAASQESQA